MEVTTTVVGPDGRTWTVRRNIEWFPPATGDEFEHDIWPLFGSLVCVVMVALAWVALLRWFPPTGLLQVVLTAALPVLLPPAYAIRRCVRRPWTLVAETPGTNEHDPEHWVGFVRGFRRAEEEFELVSTMLRTAGSPEFFAGPLHLLN